MFFTDINIEEVKNLQEKKNINDLKIILANETTKIMHGEIKSSKAEKIASDLFTLGKINKDLPTNKIYKKDIKAGMKLLDLLVNKNIMNSKSEVRRAIKNNGIKINDLLVQDEKRELSFTDFKDNNMKVSFGKKKHYLFELI